MTSNFTSNEMQPIEVEDTTNKFYDFCKNKRVLFLLDGENITISARKDLDSTIDLDTLAAKLQRTCAIADLHVCASGTNPNDVVGCPYPKSWNLHIFPVLSSEMIAKEKASQSVYRKDKDDTRYHNADPLIFFKAGQLLPLKKYQVLVIATGDGDLGCFLSKIAKSQYGDNIDIVTLSLAGGSTSMKLEAGKNNNIAANFEIGYDLFIPFGQPKVASKPTIWNRFCSFCYNLMHA